MSADIATGYANPDLIWSAEQLHDRIGDPNLRIVDTRPGEAFAMGHIPGAHHFNTQYVTCDDTDEAPLNSFLRMWAYLLGQRNVAFDNTILFYDDSARSPCTRAFWLLELFDHKDVHILDGGYAAWERAGLPTTRDAAMPAPADFRHTFRPERMATYRDVLAAIDDPDKVILDARSPEERAGTDVRASRTGSIPNAVHVNWTEHFNADGTIKSAAGLRAVFEAAGVTPDKEIIPYCQSGGRSSHAYFVLRLLGYPRIRNYMGSWREWGNREGMPIDAPRDS
jgi:thiosulfate/3-mercaptopyruvate sulfurtransferase